jgi:mannobiose 2-epimerase
MQQLAFSASETGAGPAQVSAARIRRSLRADLLDCWFPRCVSPHGGFHQDYQRDWTPISGDSRSLVFQARLTWVAGAVAQSGGKKARDYCGYARHGLEFLERMAAASGGAFLWDTDPAGRPIGPFARQVHAYGMAFAIFALAEAARALSSERALAAAKRAFHYLELYHHDAEHGGYFEVTNGAGRPILSPRLWRRRDAIGTRFGLKSHNSHLHLLEAFISLHSLWPDERVTERLNELVGLMTGSFWIEPGRSRHYMTREWHAVGESWSSGHSLEVAHLLLAAAHALGRPQDGQLLGSATTLVETALAEDWHSEGGFFDALAQDRLLPGPVKTWWVQAEGLAALASLYAATGEQRYRNLLDRHWAWIENSQIDREHGGWFESVAADGRPVGNLRKGHRWKDAYHEVRASLMAAAILDGVE